MTIFKIYKQDRQIVFNIFGLKIKFKNPFINYLGELCMIPDIEYVKAQGTKFPHPMGIVLGKRIKLGKNCIIFQNVTIGLGKYDKENKTNFPILGNDVIVYANSVIIGGVKIGDGAIIGAGSVVIHNVEPYTTVAGNPAKVINKDNREYRKFLENEV